MICSGYYAGGILSEKSCQPVKPSGLAKGFSKGHCRGNAHIDRAQFGAHGYAHSAVAYLADLIGHPGAFPPGKYYVIGGKVKIIKRSARFRGEQDQAFVLCPAPVIEPGKTVVLVHLNPAGIVHDGSLEIFVGKDKSARVNNMNGHVKARPEP